MNPESIQHEDVSATLVRAADASGAVLLLPSVFGVDAHALAFAHRLAEARLTTLIWEPFPGQPEPKTREQRAERLDGLTDAGALGAMQSLLARLANESGSVRIGVAGFCLGGRYSLLLAAKDPRIAACLPYYPTIESPPLPGQDEDPVALASAIACPVHMVRAGRDHLTGEDTFLRLQAALQGRAAPTTIQIYPQGDHGFMQRGGGANDVAIRLSTPQAVAFLAAALTPI